MVARFSRLILIALLCAVPLGAVAQSPQPAVAPTQPLLKAPELDQLVAPIALHPDPLLSEILIAATYPLEVVQADRWAKSNKALKGDALTGAIAKQSWDDSVKSLVQVPTVLAMMAEQLDWTQKLGDAMLAQQADVMDAIQRLRAPRAEQRQAQVHQGADGHGQDRGRQAIRRDRAGLADRNLRPVLRARRGLRGLAISRLCAVLFPATLRLLRRRRARRGHRIHGRRCHSPCLLGQLRLGSPQHQRRVKSVRRHQQHQSRQMGAQRRSPPRREIQQRRRAAEIRQDRRPGRQAGAAGFSRQGRPEGARSTWCGRSRPPWRRRSRPVQAIDRLSSPKSAQRPAQQPKVATAASAAAQGGAAASSSSPRPRSGQLSNRRRAQRPSQPRRDSAFSGVQSGARVQHHANRGRQSMGGRGGAPRARAARGGGGRRSAIRCCCSSTTSRCLATSTTDLASIASAMSAMTAPMSASWHRRCRRSRRRRSRAAATAT